MQHDSLEDILSTVGEPVEFLRDLGLGTFTKVPDEYTHWIEEQRSWRESVALADQSYHMTELQFSGPDALELLRDVGVNNFDEYAVGKAKQLVVANPHGKFIGDAVLFHVAENEFLSVGGAAAHNWLEYQAEIGEYDVSVSFQPRPVAAKIDPNYFRFQLQGPNAVALMETVADEPLPELPFFNFSEVSVAGTTVQLFRHGMAGETGFEFWGPYEEGESVKAAIVEAGKAYDLRRLGGKSYQSANVMLGWVPLPLPAVYSGEEMKSFREWVDARRGILSIGGSYDSDDIEDYYVSPLELGYDHIVDLDHDFIGRDAIAADMERSLRKKVTLEWDPDDVQDAFGSLFSEDPARYMKFPVPRSAACHYDTVRSDDEHVGVSKWMSYIYNEKSMLSLALIDEAYAEPGTELTLVWGEADGSDNPVVERHSLTEIDVTVAPAPYKADNR